MILTVLGMVAQMERRFIKERQREGIPKAKASGACRGWQRRLDRARVFELSADGAGVSSIAKEMGCSRMQIYRVLKEPVQPND